MSDHNTANETTHGKIEKNIGVMMVLILLAISVGALVELVPLAFQKDVTEPIKGLMPLNALQLEGRDIYIREGCHVCHSQMIRPFRAETERYGHYSVAGESVYEHPFLWGSKRTGPDLARVGGRYSDEWHRAHLYNPRDVVPESIMPAYHWLFDATLDGIHTGDKMKALRTVGVPYTDADIEGAKTAVEGKAEIDALIAYLQQLGLLIPANVDVLPVKDDASPITENPATK
jgi:cytochrome c oxidase cbb3-type subunit 2